MLKHVALLLLLSMNVTPVIFNDGTIEYAPAITRKSWLIFVVGHGWWTVEIMKLLLPQKQSLLKL